MSMRFVRPVATASFALVALAGVAQADTLTTYSSQAAFLAATNGGAGLGFENYDSMASGTSSNSMSFTGGGSTMVADATGSFASASNAIIIVGAPFGLPSNHLASNYFVNTLRLSFAPGVNAFATDVWSYPGASTLSIDVLDSSSVVHNYLVSRPSGPGGFFGFTVSGGSVLRVVISTSGDAGGIDNTYWGNANLSVVPLPPAALAGMGGLAGVGIVGAIRRRRVAK